MGKIIELDNNRGKIKHHRNLMQATVKSYYTISSTVLLQHYGDAGINAIDATVRLNILLDVSPEDFPALFRLLGTLQNDFLFSLPASLINNLEALRNLLPALFLLASMDHFSGDNVTLIPVLNDPADKATSAGLALIKTYFKEQDIQNPELPFFYCQPESGMQEKDSCSFCAYPLEGNYQPGPVNTAVFVVAFIPAPHNITVFNQCIATFTAWPLTFSEQATTANEKASAGEIQRWQKRALLYREFLELSKTVQQQEYYEVLNWYRREYEILPLWYKRFGHIIKVIMGKRSFRSLFSDNVKKYKD